MEEILPTSKFVAAVAAAILGGAAAGALAVAQPAIAAGPSALSQNWYASAPYLMPLSNNPPDPTVVMAATGQKAFQLAFILAPAAGGCSATWDGTSPVAADTAVGAVINKIRGAGGDVSVSVGGYGGTKLGQVCADASSTAAAYQAVVSKYALKALDFDLEEPEYENTTAINNEVGAAKILQANNPGLYISITVPGTTSGTGYFGQNVLNTAKGLGFTPNNFSIMPFDGGFSGGSAQVAALEGMHSLLMSHLGWDSATAYTHEGFSGMNGKSDASEYFYQADFQTVLDYATSHHLGRFTFWSVNRDRQCGASTDNGTCSNVPQQDWDFTRLTAKFAGATTPTTPPTTSSTSSTPPVATSTPPTTGCSAPIWASATQYRGGAGVSYNGRTWTAKWWTQGDVPGANSQNVWTDAGLCTTDTPPSATPTTAPTSSPGCSTTAWNAALAYSGGAPVSYNNHNWTAQWWTQGDIPGSNSQNVWTDNGTCK